MNERSALIYDSINWFKINEQYFQDKFEKLYWSVDKFGIRGVYIFFIDSEANSQYRLNEYSFIFLLLNF